HEQATPRRSVEILAVFGRAVERAGLRVHAAYDAPDTRALTMLVDDETVPEAARALDATFGAAVFDVFVPLAGATGAPPGGTAGPPVGTVAFGLDLGDGRVRLFHRFAYDISGVASDAGAAWRAATTR